MADIELVMFMAGFVTGCIAMYLWAWLIIRGETDE